MLDVYLPDSDLTSLNLGLDLPLFKVCPDALVCIPKLLGYPNVRAIDAGMLKEDKARFSSFSLLSICHLTSALSA